ncbi:MAG: tetratricopeptide repeat protein [Magnetococcales bacterium]|nr:tetratricopeptide repeat protein [Magnetococcales bacterium]
MSKHKTGINAAPPKLTVDSAFSQAIEHYNKENYSEADKLCTAILQVVPNHINAINLIGVIAQRINRHDLAIEQFSRAIKIDSSKDWLLYNLGTSLYYLGRLNEAVKTQKEAISLNPNNAQAYSSLGCSLTELGMLDDAIVYLTKAVKIKENYADAHYNLGVAYQAQGNLMAAVNCYELTISFAPNFTNVFINLGNTLQELQKLQAAIKNYKKAISLNPETPLAYNNLGNAYKKQGDFVNAIASLNKAILLNPSYADAYFNLGIIYKEQNDWEKAINCFKKTVSINNKHIQGYNNLASTYKEVDELEKAVYYNEQALTINPDNVESYINLGDILHEQEKLEQAISYYQKAIAIQPNNVEAHCNLGATQQAQGNLGAADTSFKKVIAIDPLHTKAHCNLSLVQLLNGDFDNGFKNYIWRWEHAQFDCQRYQKAKNILWQGEPLTNKKILLWEEQGVGENILFSSMVPDLVKQGAKVYIECDKRLIPIYSRSFKKINCQTKEKFSKAYEQQNFDFSAPLGNLGLYLRNNKSSFPKSLYHLVACEKQKKQFRKRYQGQTKDLLVGISWRSNKSSGFLTKKSIDLKQLHPLLKIPGVQFVNLQYGDTAKERAELTKESGVEIFHDDSFDQLVNLDAFASQVASMDIIVTISNTTAHMAGALGVPTYLLLGVTPLWYWMMEGAYSPWYPSIKILRQKKVGCWDKVIEKVSEEMKMRVDNTIN